MNRCASGNSLMEYGLIAAVVMVAGIGVLLGLGGDFNQWLQGLRQDMAGKASNAAWVQAARAAATPQGSGIDGVIPPPETGQEQLCYGNGYCVNIPVVDEGTRLTTSGSNGGELTKGFASVLEQLAEQMKKDPNADSKLADLISQLANQGHTLGDAQKHMYVFSKTPAPREVFSHLKTTVQANGTVLNFHYQELNDYLAAHPEALSPDIKSLIDLQVQQIRQTTQPYLNVHEHVIPVTMPGSGANLVISNFQLDPNASKLTHMDSNTICRTGGHQCLRTLTDPAVLGVSQQNTATGGH